METDAKLSNLLHSTKLGPEVPKPKQDVNNQSLDDRIAELNRLPLFMRDLDETDGANGENSSLEALKALAFDGDPWEVATSFKKNGNDAFKRKSYKDAIEHYTKALQTKCGQPEIDEACYVNRAACNLELENYGKVLADCSKALKINPKNMKALYRSSKACIAVDRLDEAQDVITRGLSLEPGNKSLLGQLEILQRRLERALDKRKRDDERKQKLELEKYNLNVALRSRNISVVKSRRPPDTGDAKIYLSDPRDSSSSLVFPTMFLYPLTYQSDFLAQFAEVYTVQSQLDIVLEQAPPWDDKKQYTPKSVDCFMETTGGGLIKLGKKATLGTALGSGKVEVVDGIVRIHVVPKTAAAAWIDAFKAEKELTRTN